VITRTAAKIAIIRPLAEGGLYGTVDPAGAPAEVPESVNPISSPTVAPGWPSSLITLTEVGMTEPFHHRDAGGLASIG